jgi:hypothetical protein
MKPLAECPTRVARSISTASRKATMSAAKSSMV